MSDLELDVFFEETCDLRLDVSRDVIGPVSEKGGEQWPRHGVRFEIGRLQTSDFQKTLKN